MRGGLHLSGGLSSKSIQVSGYFDTFGGHLGSFSDGFRRISHSTESIQVSRYFDTFGVKVSKYAVTLCREVSCYFDTF